MNPQDEKIYYSLRDEIRYNQNQENVICTFTYTTCVAILAFAFNQSSEWAAVLAQLALIPFAYKVGRFRDSISYLASYLCVVVEPKINGSWERDNKTYRTEYPYLKGALVIISRCDFLLLDFICLAAYWGISLQKEVMVSNLVFFIIQIVIQLISLTTIVIFTYKYSDVGKMKNEKIKNWNILKADNKLI